jgi:hypothetical protein
MAGKSDAINTNVLNDTGVGEFKERKDIEIRIKDKALREWLLGFGEKVNTASVCYRNFRGFYEWLQGPENMEHSELRGKTPDELAELQFLANRAEGYRSDAESMKIAGALLRYLESNKTWRTRYKSKIYSSVKSFFDAHDKKIPFPKLGKNKTRIKGEPRAGKELTFEELKLIIDGSNPCYKALFSCMLASGMGLGEALEWSDQGIDRLTDALANPVKHDQKVIEIHLNARKGNSEEDFYVYIGGSALTYLEAWLKHRRMVESRFKPTKERSHFPTAVFVGNTYNPINQKAVQFYWLAQLRLLGKYNKLSSEKTNRTNRNIHQIRSVYRTRASRAVSGEAEGKIVDYFMGHKPDQLNYNQIHTDRPMRVRTFLKALSYLDTQKSDPSKLEETFNKQIEDLTRQVNDLQNQLNDANASNLKRGELLDQSHILLDKSISVIENELKNKLDAVKKKEEEIEKGIDYEKIVRDVLAHLKPLEKSE